MARPHAPRLSMTFTLVLLAILSLLAVPAASAQFPGLDKLKKMAETQREWSLAEEKAIGQATAAKMVAIFGLYENPTMVRYVNLVGGSVSQFAGRRDLDYYFGILDTEIINAFATPGGYIFVTRGLLANLENEAELAGVLAHETIHTSERHLEKELRSRKMAALGWEEGTRQIPVAELAQLADRAADTLLAGKLSRDKEREADSKGLELVAAAGYDPVAYPEFLRWLAEGSANKENQRFLGILTASHPKYSDRVNRLEKQIKKSGWDQQEWARLAGRFEENVDFSALAPAPAEEVTLAGMEAPAATEAMESEVAEMEAAAVAAAVSTDAAASEAPAVTEVEHEPVGQTITSGVVAGSGSGAVLEMEEWEPGSDQRRMWATLYMQSEKLRVETRTAKGEEATMIFDHGRQVLWMIEPARGRYHEITAADIRRLEQQMKEMEAALAQVPAAQREMVQQMMKQKMGAPLETEVRVKGREQVGSYTCTIYEVLVNGQRNQDVWAAPFHQVSLNESDFRVFRAMGQFFEPLRRFAPQTQTGWDVKGSGEIDGFPVRWVDYEGARMVSEGKVIRAERQTLAADLFNLPAGLKKVDLGLR